jgi:hypothetical protein
MKKCNKCGVEKSEDQFRLLNGYRRRKCLECSRAADAQKKREKRITSLHEVRAQARTHYQKNREKRLAAMRVWQDKNRHKIRDAELIKKYGISLSQKQSLLDLQDGVCAICQSVPAVPHIDHCHTTGRVRGILCGRCNTGLGQFQDSLDRLSGAIRYLTNTRYAQVQNFGDTLMKP